MKFIRVATVMSGSLIFCSMLLYYRNTPQCIHCSDDRRLSGLDFLAVMICASM